MKTIKLKTIKLKNFKGIKDLEINLNEITNIEGSNASGKTTIFDAYNWLLFGKNSQNQSVFEIKTTKENSPVDLYFTSLEALEVLQKSLNFSRDLLIAEELNK